MSLQIPSSGSFPNLPVFMEDPQLPDKKSEFVHGATSDPDELLGGESGVPQLGVFSSKQFEDAVNSFVVDFDDNKLPPHDPKQEKRLKLALIHLMTTKDHTGSWDRGNLSQDAAYELADIILGRLRTRSGDGAGSGYERFKEEYYKVNKHTWSDTPLDHLAEDSWDRAHRGWQRFEDAVNTAVVAYQDDGARLDNVDQQNRLRFAMTHAMLTKPEDGFVRGSTALEIAEEIEGRVYRRLKDAYGTEQADGWTRYLHQEGGMDVLQRLADEAWDDANRINETGHL